MFSVSSLTETTAQFLSRQPSEDRVYYVLCLPSVLILVVLSMSGIEFFQRMFSCFFSIVGGVSGLSLRSVSNPLVFLYCCLPHIYRLVIYFSPSLVTSYLYSHRTYCRSCCCVARLLLSRRFLRCSVRDGAVASLSQTRTATQSASFQTRTCWISCTGKRLRSKLPPEIQQEQAEIYFFSTAVLLPTSQAVLPEVTEVTEPTAPGRGRATVTLG